MPKVHADCTIEQQTILTVHAMAGLTRIDNSFPKN
jgi:hypothetical protein